MCLNGPGQSTTFSYNPCGSSFWFVMALCRKWIIYPNGHVRGTHLRIVLTVDIVGLLSHILCLILQVTVFSGLDIIHRWSDTPPWAYFTASTQASGQTHFLIGIIQLREEVFISTCNRNLIQLTFCQSNCNISIAVIRPNITIFFWCTFTKAFLSLNPLHKILKLYMQYPVN
jgi:hypothetical protein